MGPELALIYGQAPAIGSAADPLGPATTGAADHVGVDCIWLSRLSVRRAARVEIAGVKRSTYHSAFHQDGTMTIAAA